jgi:hypothetical protein
MKHLKLFEDIKLYSKSKEFEYYEISEIEPSIEFTKIIKEWCNENNWQCSKPPKRDWITIYTKFKDKSMLGAKVDNIKIYIKETEDEWYYISVRQPFEKYYKCDQLDGLINFLNYINSIDDIIEFMKL